ncbi:potassium channel family protein [Brevibacillus porteri]|uniref:potassium channel family protein n=1 Tax=Brevibacillus porteri TaxID=2126350 RepID=UPI00363D5788
MSELRGIAVLSFFVFVLLIFGLFFLRIRLRQYFYILFKSLSLFVSMSSFVIVLFSILYMVILMVDLQSNEKLIEQGLLVRGDFANYKISFNGLKFEDYSSFTFLYLDILYFSAITYLTIGYGDITLLGAWRVFPIIEGLIGVGVSTVVMGLIISEYMSQHDKERARIRTPEMEVVMILLSRGWDITDYKLKMYDKRKVHSFYVQDMKSGRKEYFYIWEDELEVSSIINKFIKVNEESNSDSNDI